MSFELPKARKELKRFFRGEGTNFIAMAIFLPFFMKQTKIDHIDSNLYSQSSCHAAWHFQAVFFPFSIPNTEYPQHALSCVFRAGSKHVLKDV